MDATLGRTLRLVGAVGLFAVGSLHAAWAAGSPFPARSRTELARAVVGNDEMPHPVACAAVAALTLGTGIVVAGAGGEEQTPTLVRISTGAALLGRGAVGGAGATRVLGLPQPGEPFRRLDARFYRPLCLALGAAVLASARVRSGE